jgi:calcineurin-like phosphoesterase
MIALGAHRWIAASVYSVVAPEKQWIKPAYYKQGFFSQILKFWQLKIINILQCTGNLVHKSEDEVVETFIN